jgi:hypothetical protein
LVTIAFIIDNYLSGTSSPTTVSKNIRHFISTQEDDFDRLSEDTVLLTSLSQNTYNEKLLQELTEKKYFLFLYKKSEYGELNLRFWNTQVVDPLRHAYAMEGKTGFIQLVNGYYVWRKATYNNLMAIALIPVKWNYVITNEYLKNSFTTGEKIENIYSISEQKRGIEVSSKEGKFLFSLELKAGGSLIHNNLLAEMLKVIAALFVLIFLQFIATWIVQRNFFKGVFFLILTVCGLRVISYYLPVPINFRQFELFDPAVYGSNAVLRTLGDLLINAILFLWMVLFIRYYIQENKVIIRIRNRFANWIIVLGGLSSLVVCTFISGHIFRSMVADSNISFDVINFYTLNEYSVIGFVVLGSIAIGYFFLTQIMIYLLQPLLPKNIMVLILMVTITGLVFLTVRIESPDAIFELYLLIWLLIYLLLLNNKYLFLLASEIISSRLIFWMFFFSLSIDLIILVENNKKEIEQRKRYAVALATKADPSSERLMNTVLTDFRSEALAPIFDRFKTLSSNKILKDSLLNENFTGYLNKYDTRIFTFNQNEQPLFNEDSTTFNTLNTILKTQGKPTAVQDLYFYDISYDRFNYISKKDILDSANSLVGYVFILASPKNYKTDALYPELFLKGYEKSIENSPVYSYAIYNKLKLVGSHNEYAFRHT